MSSQQKKLVQFLFGTGPPFQNIKTTTIKFMILMNQFYDGDFITFSTKLNSIVLGIGYQGAYSRWDSIYSREYQFWSKW